MEAITGVQFLSNLDEVDVGDFLHFFQEPLTFGEQKRHGCEVTGKIIVFTNVQATFQTSPKQCCYQTLQVPKMEVRNTYISCM